MRESPTGKGGEVREIARPPYEASMNSVHRSCASSSIFTPSFVAIAIPRHHRRRRRRRRFHRPPTFRSAPSLSLETLRSPSPPSTSAHILARLPKSGAMSRERLPDARCGMQ